MSGITLLVNFKYEIEERSFSFHVHKFWSSSKFSVDVESHCKTQKFLALNIIEKYWVIEFRVQSLRSPLLSWMRLLELYSLYGYLFTQEVLFDTSSVQKKAGVIQQAVALCALAPCGVGTTVQVSKMARLLISTFSEHLHWLHSKFADLPSQCSLHYFWTPLALFFLVCLKLSFFKY